MIAIIIFNIIGLLLLALLIGWYIREHNKENDFPSFVIIPIFPLITMLMFCNIAALFQPTPLDVYKGNTELEITTINGVPTDTIVVWKNKVR